MDGNRIEFVDVSPRSDGDADDVLAIGPDHRPPNRMRRATTALAGMAVLVTLVVWAHLHTRDNHTSSPTATVPPSPTTSTPREHTVPFAPLPSLSIGYHATTVPAYGRWVSTTRDGDILVQGTPAVVRRTLTTEFSVVSDVQVRTVLGDTGTDQPTDDVAAEPFLSRFITARSDAYRVQVLVVRRTAGGHASDFRLAPTPRGSSLSFAEIRHSGYVIDVVVSGPNTMSLIRLEHSPLLLDGLIGGS